MKNYEVLELNNEIYKVMIVSTTYETPFQYSEQIAEELKALSLTRCSILFDLLLSAGNSSDRFIEILFNGEDFVFPTAQVVNIEKKSSIRELSCAYLRANENLLMNSILTSTKQKMIKAGITI